MNAICRFAWIALTMASLGLGGCAETEFIASTAKRITGSADPTASPAGEGGRYKIGDPYKIDDIWYYPKVDYAYRETGIASWYGPKFDGRPTANGETFDMNQISAAHRTLPLPSIARVTNLGNGRSLKVRVNDRGPFAHGRIIDMSRRAAQLLGFEEAGTAKIRVEVLAQESRQLAASLGVTQPNAFSLETASQKPPPTAAPRITVTSTSLAAPAGSNVAPPPTNNHKVVALETAPKRDLRAPLAAPVIDDSVTVVPVNASPRIFVQAGAFTQFDNANRLRAMLSLIGPTKIFQVRIVQRPLFRVRMGPLASVRAADRMLASVLAAGHRDARIIVD